MADPGRAVPVHGECDERFAAVRAALAEGVSRGEDMGASVAIVHEGARVVDLCAGSMPATAEGSDSRAWERDTLVTVLSATKGLGATVVAMAVDRGKLEYTTPVARYWPEFGRASKSEITVEQLLSHTAGLPTVERELSPGAGTDWRRMVETLEAQTPLWEPGTQTGYHAVTWSWLVGELVRRALGRTLSDFAREEICAPLGIEFYVGTPASVDPRISRLVLPAPGDAPPWPPDSLMARAMRVGGPPLLPALDTRAFRALELVSTNGCTNARGLATLYGALAQGGHPLLRSEALERATRSRVAGVDRVLGHAVRRAAGWHLSATGSRYSWARNVRVFGHSGAGGSLGFADPVAGIGFGFAMNRLVPGVGADPRWARLVSAMYRSLADSA